MCDKGGMFLAHGEMRNIFILCGIDKEWLRLRKQSEESRVWKKENQQILYPHHGGLIAHQVSIHLCMHVSIHPSIHPCMHVSIHVSMYPCNEIMKFSLYPPIHVSIHPCLHVYIHVSMQWNYEIFTVSTHPCIHASMYP